MRFQKAHYWLLLILIWVSCSEPGEEPNLPPKLSTNIAEIDAFGLVKLSAEVELNGHEVTNAGFEISTDPDMENDVELFVDIEVVDDGFEYLILDELEKTVTYHFRPFIESGEIIYGDTKYFTFDGYNPKIDSLSHESAQVGDTIIVYGKHLDEGANVPVVLFENTPAEILSESETEIQCIVPPALTISNTNIEVRINGKTSNKAAFSLLTPTIGEIEPTFGYDKDLITIRGSHFSWVKELNEITIQGIDAEVVSSTREEIQFYIPEMSFFGSTPITLKVGPQTITSTSELEVRGPIIESLSASEGHSGDYVTIQGKYFTQNGNTTQVYFGTYEAEIIEYNSESILVVVPYAINRTLEEINTNLRVTNGMKSSAEYKTFRILKSWITTAATPFSWGWNYSAFDYNGKGYIYEVNANRFYAYNPASDSWQVTGSVDPGENDENHLLISYEDKVYKIGGINHLGPLKRFSIYDFTTDTWTQKNELPFSFRNATYFIHSDDAFIITNEGKVWKYNFTSDQFVQKTDFPTTYNQFASAYEHMGEFYVITYGQTFKYNMNSDSWTEFMPNEFQKRNYSEHAIGFQSSGITYVLADGQYVYRLDNDNSRWVLSSKYPGCRGDNSYKVYFTIEGKTYIVATSGNYGGCSPLAYSYDRN
ncbi:MAG: IPT/TIG domain-containing protein [Cytophagia bacterium]|nr:IPT/TIG domain-containing protein [Cytophagia bacterium]